VGEQKKAAKQQILEGGQTYSQVPVAQLDIIFPAKTKHPLQRISCLTLKSQTLADKQKQRQLQLNLPKELLHKAPFLLCFLKHPHCFLQNTWHAQFTSRKQRRGCKTGLPYLVFETF